MKSGLLKVFPILSWIRTYDLRMARWDIIAGITLASFVLPESMAYASLAGVPSQYGIYCCIAGCLFFALLTQARQVAVGPTSAISLMVGTTVAVMSGGDLQRWGEIASLTALAVFVLCVAAYFLRLSTLVNFISENILLGFKAGAALTIAVTQLPKLFGVEGGGSNFFERLLTLIRHMPESNPTTLWFGLIALILLMTGNRLLKGRPVALVIVVVSILLISVLPDIFSDLHLTGIIPAGLPEIARPSLRLSDVDGVLGLALGVFLMGYIETMAISRTLAEKNGYQVDPHQELLSLGAANLGAGFFSGYPVSGGVSQSTVNDKAGAKTPMALIVCSATLCVLLLFFTGLLRNLPEVILAVVVVDAVFGLIKIKELRRVYQLNQKEFWIAMLAVVAVLVFGILKGVLLTAIASLIVMIASISYPVVALLGRVPGSEQFSDLERHPDNQTWPACRIIRVQSSILYFNQQYVSEKIMDIAAQSDETRLVVLDLSACPMMDVAGSGMLLKLQHALADRGMVFKIVNALADVRDLLRKQGMEHSIGHISRKLTVQQVIDEFLGEAGSVTG